MLKGGYRQKERQWIVTSLFTGSNPVIHLSNIINGENKNSLNDKLLTKNK